MSAPQPKQRVLPRPVMEAIDRLPDTVATRAEKNVLRGFAYFVDENLIAWPHAATVAKKIGLEKNWVQKVISRLKKKGLLKIIEANRSHHKVQLVIPGLALTHATPPANPPTTPPAKSPVLNAPVPANQTVAPPAKQPAPHRRNRRSLKEREILTIHSNGEKMNESSSFGGVSEANELDKCTPQVQANVPRKSKPHASTTVPSHTSPGYDWWWELDRRMAESRKSRRARDDDDEEGEEDEDYIEPHYPDVTSYEIIARDSQAWCLQHRDLPSPLKVDAKLIATLKRFGIDAGQALISRMGTPWCIKFARLLAMKAGLAEVRNENGSYMDVTQDQINIARSFVRSPERVDLADVNQIPRQEWTTIWDYVVAGDMPVSAGSITVRYGYRVVEAAKTEELLLAKREQEEKDRQRARLLLERILGNHEPIAESILKEQAGIEGIDFKYVSSLGNRWKDRFNQDDTLPRFCTWKDSEQTLWRLLPEPIDGVIEILRQASGYVREYDLQTKLTEIGYGNEEIPYGNAITRLPGMKVKVEERIVYDEEDQPSILKEDCYQLVEK